MTNSEECPYDNDHDKYAGPCPECGLDMNTPPEDVF